MVGNRATPVSVHTVSVLGWFGSVALGPVMVIERIILDSLTCIDPNATGLGILLTAVRSWLACT